VTDSYHVFVLPWLFGQHQGILTELDRIITADVIVPTSSDELLLILEIYYYFLAKQVILIMTTFVQSLPLQ